MRVMSTRGITALNALIRSLKKALGRAEKAKEEVVVQVKKKSKRAKKVVETPGQVAAYQAALQSHVEQMKKLAGNVESVGDRIKVAEKARREAIRRAETYKPPLDRWGK